MGASPRGVRSVGWHAPRRGPPANILLAARKGKSTKDWQSAVHPNARSAPLRPQVVMVAGLTALMTAIVCGWVRFGTLLAGADSSLTLHCTTSRAAAAAGGGDGGPHPADGIDRLRLLCGDSPAGSKWSHTSPSNTVTLQSNTGTFQSNTGARSSASWFKVALASAWTQPHRPPRPT